MKLIRMELTKGDVYLKTMDVPAVPEKGESFRFDCQDYVVVSRMWAADRNNDQLYCYVRLR